MVRAGEGGDAHQLWRASALLAQLPEGARLRVLEHPDESWDTSAQLLRLVEYELRAWIMAHVEDAQEQEPLPLPSDELRRSERAKRDERDMLEVARALGLIDPQGGEHHAG